MTGITFGKRHAPLQVQIYDKSREIRGYPQKGWVESAWATKETYSKRLPVIRAELRFSRTLLKNFDIETIANLRSKTGDLIGYAVGGARPWFRVASPDTRGHKTERREASSSWKEISRAFLKGMPETGRVRRRSASSGSSVKRARSSLVTSAVQTAAWDKALGSHPDPSADDYLGPVALQQLPAWLEAKHSGSWDDAVDHGVKILESSGKLPPAPFPH